MCHGLECVSTSIFKILFPYAKVLITSLLWGNHAYISSYFVSQVVSGAANNIVYNGKRKHIRMKHGSDRHLEKCMISLEYVRYGKKKVNYCGFLRKGNCYENCLECAEGISA